MNDAIKVFFSEEDSGYIAIDENRPGCSAFGITKKIALIELVNAQCAWDSALENRDKK